MIHPPIFLLLSLFIALALSLSGCNEKKKAPDTERPSTPHDVYESDIGSRSATLNWQASTDNIGVTHYTIYRDNKLISTVTDTHFIDKKLLWETNYEYTISAQDAAGNTSAKSDVVAITTHDFEPRSGLIINEVLAGNTHINMDTDYYKFSDWIELYNNTDDDIELSGYYLSDNKEQPKKWQIPKDTYLDSYEHLLIWADKRNTQGNELHTNFSLSSKGETITLSDVSGTVIDTLLYKKLASNTSVSKTDDDELIYLVPTPYSYNSHAFLNKTASKDPDFSDSAGFYDGQLILEIGHKKAAQIYYTSDGSIPTTLSTKYEDELYLDETTLIKAIAVEHGKLPSKVVTNTYFIDHESTLPVVSLSMENDHLFDDTVGIYTVGTNGVAHKTCNDIVANYVQDWDRPVFIEYFDEHKNRALAFGADTGVSGECSRRKIKKSFGFELNGKYGKKSLRYKLYPGKDLGKIKDFKIRTANNGYRIGDILGAQLVEHAGLNIDYQAYRAIQMFMNGEYWGIYNIREKKGTEYLESNDSNLGKVDIVKAFIVKAGDDVEHYKFNSFLQNTDLANNDNYQQALTLFDENNFIDYMAFMLYNGNLDWIGGNHRYWRERKKGAKWRWMVDDIDWGFLSTLDFAGKGYAVNTNYFELLKHSDSSTSIVLLFNGLMRNNSFKDKFKTRFNQLLDEYFTEDFIMPIVNQIDNERKDYIHLEKFKGMSDSAYLTSYTDYIEDDIRNFVRVRTEKVRQQLNQAIP